MISKPGCKTIVQFATYGPCYRILSTFPRLVMYHSLCLMFHQYHYDYGWGIPLEPPIQFGNLSGYNTRTESTFAHSVRCHLTFSQHSFRHKVTVFWNSLPTAIRNHLRFSDFKDELKTYFLSYL